MGAAFRYDDWPTPMTVDIGSPNGATPETFTPTTANVSVYDIAVELYDWLAGAGRSWYLSTTFVVELFPVGARYGVAFYSTGADMSVAASLFWTMSLGTASAAGTYKSVPVLGHNSTIAPRAAVLRGWLPWNKSPGAVSSAGAFVAGSPASNLHRPECRWILDAAGAIALANAAAVASTPRVAHVVASSTASTGGIDIKADWRAVSVGPIKPPRRQGELYAAGLEVVG